MKPLFFFHSILLAIVLTACNGGTGGSPLLPGDSSPKKILSLYSMQVQFPGLYHTQSRDAQAEHGYIELIPNNSEYPYTQGDNFDIEAELIDFDRQSGVLSVDFIVKNRSELRIFDPRLVVFFPGSGPYASLYRERQRVGVVTSPCE